MLLEGLDQWFETLRFPLRFHPPSLAGDPESRLQSQAQNTFCTVSSRATAEFLSVIMLECLLRKRGTLRAPQAKKLAEAMQSQNLSFQRRRPSARGSSSWSISGNRPASCLGVTRKGGPCAGISFRIRRWHCPKLSAGRNWRRSFRQRIRCATTGVVTEAWWGPRKRRLRNEQLLSEVKKLREVTADTWSETRANPRAPLPSAARDLRERDCDPYGQQQRVPEGDATNVRNRRRAAISRSKRCGSSSPPIALGQGRPFATSQRRMPVTSSTD